MSEAIHPRTMREMTIAEMDAFIEGIRERRTTYVEALKRRSSISGSVREQEFQSKFDAVAKRIKKKMEKIDKDMEAMGLLVNKLRVLELEFS